MAAPGLGYEILGAVKVKDGLFVGDELAAQDLEFVVANKVTRVINCCGRQVPNHWEPIGVIYLTYYWVDADNQIILDQRDVVPNEVFRFIEEALEGAESVLVHSVRGQSRSCCLLSAYLMKKYSWGLRKTMEFLSSRRPDLNLKPAFLQQLSGYERRLMSQSKVPFSLDWNEGDFSRLECEELLLRNTYINSQMGPLAEFHVSENWGHEQPRKLVWFDGNSDDQMKLEKPAGADRHNLHSCKSTPIGQPPALKGVIKKVSPPSSLPQSTYAPLGVQLSGGYGGYGAGTAPAPLSSGCGGYASVPTKAPSFMGATGPGVGGPMDTVLQAWAAQGDVIAVPRVSALGGYAGGNASSDAHEQYAMAGAPQSVATPPFQVLAQQRGPATSIRDSLLGIQPSQRGRCDSPEPGNWPASRDPSPKTGSTASYRGDSPIRLLSRPQPQRAASPSLAPQPARPPQVGAHPQAPPGSLGFALGYIRPSTAPAAQGPPVPGGMGAFRSGGPVRAKADIIPADRRGRPATAPSARGSSSGSRPGSLVPGPQQAGSQSRLASPQAQAPSPVGQPSRAQAMPYTVGPYPVCPSPNSYPVLDHTKQRSLSSHMRRAPSPTPAFNRNSSPSRPRWRS